MSELNKENRWDWIVSEVNCALGSQVFLERTPLTFEDISIVTNVLKDNVPFLDDSDRYINIGDRVVIKGLMKTYNYFGHDNFMLKVGEIGKVTDIDEDRVEIGCYSYHIDDLEVVK